MNRLLRRASARFYLRHPWQLVLAIAGISLGVAVYVGVDLANDGAERAFELSAAVVRGQATHRLLPVRDQLDETVYRDLVTRRGIRAAPVVELEVGITGRTGTRYPLLGVDPLEEAGVRSFTSYVPGRGTNLARLIAEPGTVLLPAALADELGVAPGDTISLSVRGRDVAVRAIGTVTSAARDAEAEPPIIADIATAQELLGTPGAISRIDLNLSPREAEELLRNAPRGTVLVPAESENRAFIELAAAFRTNLQALGLLALVVGMFLIYSTMSFAIVQRRTTLGVLRAIGLTRREVLGTVLLEALGLGLIATAIGLVLGHLLATRLIELVLRTIGDLYFSSAVSAAQPSPTLYLRGAVLGIAGTLVAAAKPALDAARSAPAAVMRRAELERGTRRAARARRLGRRAAARGKLGRTRSRTAQPLLGFRRVVRRACGLCAHDSRSDAASDEPDRALRGAFSAPRGIARAARRRFVVESHGHGDGRARGRGRDGERGRIDDLELSHELGRLARYHADRRLVRGVRLGGPAQ